MARSALRLYLDPASDPISGSLVYPDGRELAFAGWIELTAALEEARHFEPLDVVAHGGGNAASKAGEKSTIPDPQSESTSDRPEDAA
jgi:hypothetical protein